MKQSELAFQEPQVREPSAPYVAADEQLAWNAVAAAQHAPRAADLGFVDYSLDRQLPPALSAQGDALIWICRCLQVPTPNVGLARGNFTAHSSSGCLVLAEDRVASARDWPALAAEVCRALAHSVSPDGQAHAATLQALFAYALPRLGNFQAW